MKIIIKKHVKQFISLFVILVMVLSNVSINGTVAYAEEDDFEKDTFSLNSNMVSDTSITLYTYDSVYYISIDDLCKLTRCSKRVEGNVIYVIQGFWSATFNVEEQQFYDAHQSVPTTILEVSANKYAVPAIMFLSYFKATAVIKNETLYCWMDEFTAWEALNVDFQNSMIDIYDLYGGKNGVIFALTLDILMEFIMGDMGTTDGYISDAFFEALKIDLREYSSVKEYKKLSQDSLYTALHSDEGVDYVEMIKDFLPVAAEPTEWCIENYYNNTEMSFANLAYDAFEAGRHDDVQHYGKKLYDTFAKKFKTQDAAEQFFKSADYLMVFISAAAETAEQMKYTESTNNIIYNVMGKNNLDYLGISVDDNGWFSVANRYRNVLGVSFTQIESEAMKLLTDKLSWEKLIGAGVGHALGISEGVWGFSLSVARAFAKYCPLTSPSIEAFEADRKAMFLSEMQQNVYWVVRNTLRKMNGQWDNPDVYSKYIQALQLYCRTSIAMYKNLIKSTDEFASNEDYWISFFEQRIDKLAVSLYQLTTLQEDGVNSCLPLDLKSYKDNFENDLEFDWPLNRYKLMFLTERPFAMRPELFTYQEHTLDGFLCQGRGVYYPKLSRQRGGGTVATFYGDFSHSGKTDTFAVECNFNEDFGQFLFFMNDNVMSNGTYVSLGGNFEEYHYIIEGATTAYHVEERIYYEQESNLGDGYYFYNNKYGLSNENLFVFESITIEAMGEFHWKETYYVDHVGSDSLIIYVNKDYGTNSISEALYVEGDYFSDHSELAKYTNMGQAIDEIKDDLARYGLEDRFCSERSELKNYTPVLSVSLYSVPKTIDLTTMEDTSLQGKLLVGIPRYTGAWDPDGVVKDAIIPSKYGDD